MAFLNSFCWDIRFPTAHCPQHYSVLSCAQGLALVSVQSDVPFTPVIVFTGQRGSHKGKNPLKAQIRQANTDKKLEEARQTVARWIEASNAATVSAGAPKMTAALLLYPRICVHGYVQHPLHFCKCSGVLARNPAPASKCILRASYTVHIIDRPIYLSAAQYA